MILGHITSQTCHIITKISHFFEGRNFEARYQK